MSDQLYSVCSATRVTHARNIGQLKMESLIEKMTFDLNPKCSQGNTWEVERKHLWKRREMH